MNNINTYGSYTIGSQSLDCVHTSLKDVLRLDLERKDEQLTQSKYTLDDLRDLESKLVLITSQDSEESGEVDLFMKVNLLPYLGRSICACVSNVPVYCASVHTMPLSKPLRILSVLSVCM